MNKKMVIGSIIFAFISIALVYVGFRINIIRFPFATTLKSKYLDLLLIFISIGLFLLILNLVIGLRKNVKVRVFLSVSPDDIYKFNVLSLIKMSKWNRSVKMRLYDPNDKKIIEKNIDRDSFSENHLKQSHILVQLVTETTFNDKRFRNEIEFAREKKQLIIPMKSDRIEWTDLVKLKLNRDLGIEFNSENIAEATVKLENFINSYQEDITHIRDTLMSNRITYIEELCSLLSLSEEDTERFILHLVKYRDVLGALKDDKSLFYSHRELRRIVKSLKLEPDPSNVENIAEIIGIDRDYGEMLLNTSFTELNPIKLISTIFKKKFKRGGRLNIFISHAITDNDNYHIQELSDSLSQTKDVNRGFICENDMRGNIDEWMEETVPISDIFVFIATQKSVFDSPDCKKEIKLAKENGLLLLPIRTSEVEWKDIKKLGLPNEGIEYFENDSKNFHATLIKFLTDIRKKMNKLELQMKIKPLLMLDVIEQKFNLQPGEAIRLAKIILRSNRVDGVITSNQKIFLGKHELRHRVRHYLHQTRKIDVDRIVKSLRIDPIYKDEVFRIAKLAPKIEKQMRKKALEKENKRLERQKKRKAKNEAKKENARIKRLNEIEKKSQKIKSKKIKKTKKHKKSKNTSRK